MSQNDFYDSYAGAPSLTLGEYLSKTFNWMLVGLLVTFGAALATIFTGAFYSLYAGGGVFLLTIVELVLVFVLSARIHSLSPGAATALFFAYAALNGINLSVYFVVYDAVTLVLAFLVGALYFGLMAAYGARTQNDLSGWGPKLYSGLIALLLVSLVGMVLNLVFGFSFGVLDLVYCAVGLLLFMGITAYDTQRLQDFYAYYAGDDAMLSKASIYGALQLYLDFINIFLYVLRILGRRSRD